MLLICPLVYVGPKVMINWMSFSFKTLISLDVFSTACFHFISTVICPGRRFSRTVDDSSKCFELRSKIQLKVLRCLSDRKCWDTFAEEHDVHLAFLLLSVGGIARAQRRPLCLDTVSSAEEAGQSVNLNCQLTFCWEPFLRLVQNNPFKSSWFYPVLLWARSWKTSQIHWKWFLFSISVEVFTFIYI